jgi:hypothetical protein
MTHLINIKAYKVKIESLNISIFNKRQLLIIDVAI